MKRVPANRYVCFAVLTLGGLWWDLYSKSTVFADLFALRRVRPMGEWFDGWLRFRLCALINHGALWGVGQGYTWLFASLSLVAVFGVIYWLFVRRAAVSLWLTTALALVMAGTLGNLYDRTGQHGILKADGEIAYGVRDFLLFSFGSFDWPVFNFADVFLVTGAIMLVLHSFQAEHGKPAADEASEGDAAKK